MSRKSTAQEYYTLMIDKNGLMPAMHRDEAGAGLAASAFMDLTVNDIVAVEKKKITVIKLRLSKSVFCFRLWQHCCHG